jgi:hypothetical protein
VDKKSATLGLAGVRERQIPLDADHNGVCKFASAEGDDYEQVSFNIVKLVKSAIKAVVERERIASLGIPSSNPLTEPACTYIPPVSHKSKMTIRPQQDDQGPGYSPSRHS